MDYFEARERNPTRAQRPLTASRWALNSLEIRIKNMFFIWIFDVREVLRNYWLIKISCDLITWGNWIFIELWIPRSRHGLHVGEGSEHLSSSNYSEFKVTLFNKLNRFYVKCDQVVECNHSCNSRKSLTMLIKQLSSNHRSSLSLKLFRHFCPSQSTWVKQARRLRMFS